MSCEPNQTVGYGAYGTNRRCAIALKRTINDPTKSLNPRFVPFHVTVDLRDVLVKRT